MSFNDISEKIRLILKRAMIKSRRNHTWFRLSCLERGICSLALKVQVKFSSMEFVRAIISVLKKLKSLSDRHYNEILRGTELAWTFSEACVSWGNKEAKSWRNDMNYVIFLGHVFGSQLFTTSNGFRLK